MATILGAEVQKKLRDIATCSEIDSSQDFAFNFCKILAEKGEFSSVQACMDQRGEKLAKELQSNPKQSKLITREREVEAVLELSEETYLGDIGDNDRQYRYKSGSTDYGPNGIDGDIHVLESGGTLAIHRDECPPSRPLRHLAIDYFKLDSRGGGEDMQRKLDQ